MLRDKLDKIYRRAQLISMRLRLHKRIKLTDKLIRSKYKLRGKPSGSIVLVVVDCLRYRNMSLAGYHRKTTPFLDRLGIALKTYATAPHTYSSVPSILSGVYPHNHGAVIAGKVKNMDKPRAFLPPSHDIILIPEVFKMYGYEVFAVSAIFPTLLALVNRGVSLIDVGKINAEELLNIAIERIKGIVKKGRSFFAYIHLGDLHEPLTQPREYRDFFGEVKQLSNIERWAFRRFEEQKGEMFEKYKSNRILLYDNTLRYVNDSLEKFITELKDIVKEPILIIITADHGEEFWEHADMEYKYFFDPRGYHGVGHGHNLFNEVIEVPLIIWSSSSEHAKIMVNDSKLISLVDLAPTILEFLDLEFNENSFDGYSLFHNLPKERYVISEAVAYGYEKKALIRGRYKLLYAPHDGVAWVFDLSNDPLEQKPIAEKELVSVMIRDLKRILVRDLVRTRIFKHV